MIFFGLREHLVVNTEKVSVTWAVCAFKCSTLCIPKLTLKFKPLASKHRDRNNEDKILFSLVAVSINSRVINYNFATNFSSHHPFCRKVEDVTSINWMKFIMRKNEICKSKQTFVANCSENLKRSLRLFILRSSAAHFLLNSNAGEP